MNLPSLQYLQKQPVITKATIKMLLNANDNYARLVLQRLYKKKIIRRVTKGIYTTKDNIYQIASHLETPAYLSLTTASSLKGYTEQIINTVHVLTTKKKELEFEQYRIVLIPTKHLFGYEKTLNPELFIADDEKLLLDMLTHQQETGNLSETIKVAQQACFDKEKIIRYLKRIGNQSLVKRVGFVLDHFSKMDISASFALDNNTVDLDMITRRGNLIDTKWRVRHDIS